MEPAEAKKVVREFLRSVECEFSPGRIVVRRCRTCGAVFEMMDTDDPLVIRLYPPEKPFVKEEHTKNCQWVNAAIALEHLPDVG